MVFLFLPNGLKSSVSAKHVIYSETESGAGARALALLLHRRQIAKQPGRGRSERGIDAMVRGAVRKILEEIKHCEDELKSISANLTLFNPRVVTLREKLKRNYLKVIKLDQGTVHEKNLSRQLWRNVFYSAIEKLRKTQRKYDESVATGNESVARDRERYQEIFASFLRKSEDFYRELIATVQKTYGSVGVLLPGEDSVSKSQKGQKILTRKLEGCCFTCYESLIFLGDILRYGQTHLKAKSQRSFKHPIVCYRQAAYLCPQSGNPHNQLSVIYLYTQDDLRAVYHNYRALYSEAPFPAAQENFELIFDKIKSRRAAAAQGAGGEGVSTAGGRRNAAEDCERNLLEASSELFHPKVLDRAGPREEACKRFVRDFKHFCSLSPQDQRTKLSKNPKKACQDIHVITFLIRATVMTICNVHTARGIERESKAKSSKPGFGAYWYLLSALSAQVDLVRYCKRLDSVGAFGFPAIKVFTSWLCCNKEALRAIDDDHRLRAKYKKYLETLTSLVKEHHASVTDKDEGANSGGGGTKYGLTEDVELRGFTPILQSQREVAYEFWERAHGPVESTHRKRMRISRICDDLRTLTGDDCVFLPVRAAPDLEARPTCVAEDTFPSVPQEEKGGHFEERSLPLPVLTALCHQRKRIDQDYVEQFWQGRQLTVRSREGEPPKKKRASFEFPKL